VLNGVVQFVEDYGCTPERAVMIAMFPDRYDLMMGQETKL